MLGHAGAPIAPHDLWSSWTLDPVLGVLLLGATLLYVASRRRRGGPAAARRRGVWFAAGMVALAVALVSPLDPLSETLFAAHMVQHLLLTLVAAPLLLLGRAHLAVVPLLPVRARRRAARWAATRARAAPGPWVVAAVAAHVLALLAWHLPVLYDVAVRLPALHVTEHVTLLATALTFWAVMGAARPRPVAVAGLAAFVASVVSVLLAATMTAATHPWYSSHLDTTAAWGLTPLRDQHLAAAIMWVPGGIIYLGAAAAAVHRWIRADERRVALQRGASPPVP